MNVKRSANGVGMPFGLKIIPKDAVPAMTSPIPKIIRITDGLVRSLHSTEITQPI